MKVNSHTWPSEVNKTIFFFAKSPNSILYTQSSSLLTYKLKSYYPSTLNKKTLILEKNSHDVPKKRAKQLMFTAFVLSSMTSRVPYSDISLNTPPHTTPHYSTPNHPRYNTQHNTPYHISPNQTQQHITTSHLITQRHTTPHHPTSHHTIPHHTTPFHILPRLTTPYYATTYHTTLHYATTSHTAPFYATPHHKKSSSSFDFNQWTLLTLLTETTPIRAYRAGAG